MSQASYLALKQYRGQAELYLTCHTVLTLKSSRSEQYKTQRPSMLLKETVATMTATGLVIFFLKAKLRAKC